MTQTNGNDELETIKEILFTVARRYETIAEIQERTDRRLDRIAQKQEENAAQIQANAAQIRTNTLAINALAESIIEMQNEIRLIWQRIQEILIELRNRFPGNGRGRSD